MQGLSQGHIASARRDQKTHLQGPLLEHCETVCCSAAPWARGPVEPATRGSWLVDFASPPHFLPLPLRLLSRNLSGGHSTPRFGKLSLTGPCRNLELDGKGSGQLGEGSSVCSLGIGGGE